MKSASALPPLMNPRSPKTTLKSIGQMTAVPGADVAVDDVGAQEEGPLPDEGALDVDFSRMTTRSPTTERRR